MVRTFVALALAAAALHAHAQAPSRGALLYGTHCVECHNSQVHWRDRRLARDWGSLQEQVRKWQDAAGLSWSDEDIRDVTRHLGESIYGFARPVAARRE